MTSISRLFSPSIAHPPPITTLTSHQPIPPLHRAASVNKTETMQFNAFYLIYAKYLYAILSGNPTGIGCCSRLSRTEPGAGSLKLQRIASVRQRRTGRAVYSSTSQPRLWRGRLSQPRLWRGKLSQHYSLLTTHKTTFTAIRWQALLR